MAKQNRDWTEILIKRGIVGPDQLKEAQRMGNVSLEEALAKLGYAEPEDIMKAKAEQHGMPFIELREIEIPPSVIELVPESLARENVVMPLAQESGTIRVIMHDPMDFETIDKLRFVLNREIEVALAPKEAIVEAINRYYGGSTSETESVDSMLQEFTDTAIDFAEDGASGGKAGSSSNSLEEGDAPVIRLVHLIIQEAVTTRASDIHIEPFVDRVRIRYRIDGVLMERDSAPRRLLGSIVSRIKIMGSIDIAEKRRPQDGRIKIFVAGKDIDLRVSILPTSHGQSVVMRILDRDNIKVGLRDLGFGDEDWKRFSQLIKRPNGILLVTGPTGSGKSTTLYACLHEIDRFSLNVITVENPVEFRLDGITQIEVNPKAGKNFASELRSILRQDPDVIMVGEIRDKETAEIACQAAQTGHMVFSTVHANDTTTAIGRLIDLGVQPFMIGSALLAVLGQRLVRRLCPQCRVRFKPSADTLKRLGVDADLVRYLYRPADPDAAPAGKDDDDEEEGPCEECGGAGYCRRTGIYELLVINDALRERIRANPDLNAIRQDAIRDGLQSLYQDGARLVVDGETSLQELLRVAKG
jgi:type IV pilus assembly protein PilB